MNKVIKTSYCVCVCVCELALNETLFAVCSKWVYWPLAVMNRPIINSQRQSLDSYRWRQTHHINAIKDITLLLCNLAAWLQCQLTLMNHTGFTAHSNHLVLFGHKTCPDS